MLLAAVDGKLGFGNWGFGRDFCVLKLGWAFKIGGCGIVNGWLFFICTFCSLLKDWISLIWYPVVFGLLLLLKLFGFVLLELFWASVGIWLGFWNEIFSTDCFFPSICGLFSSFGPLFDFYS